MRNSNIGKMTPFKEDYLKVMLELSDDMGIHSSDIANALGISRPSVSRMMSVLKDDGYIAKEKYGTITLTESGRKVAVNTKRKYDLLKAFFSGVLGVETTTAAGDACRIEHLISLETTEKIEQQLEKLAYLKKDFKLEGR